MGIATSKSYALSMLSMSVLLTFEMQLINGALFLNAKGLFFLLLLSVLATVIVHLTAIYASLKLHRSDLSIDVLNFICLLGLYLSSALPD